MPSTDELEKIVSNGTQQVYHEAIPGSDGLRFTYKEGMQLIGLSIELQQKYLFKITDMLLEERPRQVVDCEESMVPREVYFEFMKYIV